MIFYRAGFLKQKANDRFQSRKHETTPITKYHGKATDMAPQHILFSVRTSSLSDIFYKAPPTESMYHLPIYKEMSSNCTVKIQPQGEKNLQLSVLGAMIKPPEKDCGSSKVPGR